MNARTWTPALLMLALVAIAGCAASPERLRAEALAIDASYQSFDCAALADEAELLGAEIDRAQAVADSPVQWIPIVNIFALPSGIRGIQDLESAKARMAGVQRALTERGCPPPEPEEAA